MFLLRIGRRARWKSPDDSKIARSASKPEDVAEAAQDLFNPNRAGEGISLFRVVDEQQAKEAATLFAITCKETPGHVDYILLPEDALQDEKLSAVPDHTLVSPLSEKHWEMAGIDEQKARALAEKLLEKEPTVVRMDEKSIIKSAQNWKSDPTVEAKVNDRWKQRLGWK